MSKSKELQDRIDNATKAMGELTPTHTGSDVRAARLHSEIFIAASQLAELSTRRLVWLTWALVILTAVLLLFAIALYEDAHFQIKRDQAKQHYQFQNPESPESKP